MNAKDRLENRRIRVEQAKTWESRINSLGKRKKDSISEAIFCSRYDIWQSVFNRAKNRMTIPHQSLVDKVEAALKEEGV